MEHLVDDEPEDAGGRAWCWLAALLAVGSVVVELAAASDKPLLAGLAPGTRWPAMLDWQPLRNLFDTWRLWTCAWVHWSPAHLGVNLAGAVVVGAVGWRARAPARAAFAWFLAWPLTHLLMMLPESTDFAHTLQHYGGLSGVLHAGVVVLGLTLAATRLPAPARPSDPDTRFDAARASTMDASRITEGPWAVTSMEDASALHTLLPPASTLEMPVPAPPSPARSRVTRHRWIGVALVGGTVAKVLLEAPWDLALRPNAMLGIDVAPIAHACGIVAGLAAWAVVAAGSVLRR